MRIVNLKSKTVAEISTRLPYKMHVYSRVLAMSRAITVSELYIDAVKKFLDSRIFDFGFKFRKPKSPDLKKSTGKSRDATDWVQINIRLPIDLAEKLEEIATKKGVSLSSVAYTVLFWYIGFVYPPEKG